MKHSIIGIIFSASLLFFSCDSHDYEIVDPYESDPIVDYYLTNDTSNDISIIGYRGMTFKSVGIKSKTTIKHLLIPSDSAYLFVNSILVKKYYMNSDEPNNVILSSKYGDYKKDSYSKILVIRDEDIQVN